VHSTGVGNSFDILSRHADREISETIAVEVSRDECRPEPVVFGLL
jgi:hypothetical protein